MLQRYSYIDIPQSGHHQWASIDFIGHLRGYFRIQELVCPHAIQRVGEEKAWGLLDQSLLSVLTWLRLYQFPKYKIICNTSTQHQRGFRCNQCELVKSKTDTYLSAHLFGKAVDLTFLDENNKPIPANKMRMQIQMAEEYCPVGIRMEGKVNWVHIDTMHYEITDNISYF